jgi:hypothetical protein
MTQDGVSGLQREDSGEGTRRRLDRPPGSKTVRGEQTQRSKDNLLNLNQAIFCHRRNCTGIQQYTCGYCATLTRQVDNNRIWYEVEQEWLSLFFETEHKTSKLNI